MSTIDLKVPDIGDSGDVTVIEILVNPGDSIELEQSLITVESDKASMEIPAAQAGVVKEVLVKLGDKVKEGSAIVRIEAAAAEAAPAAAPAAEAPKAAPAPVQAPQAAQHSGAADGEYDVVVLGA